MQIYKGYQIPPNSARNTPFLGIAMKLNETACRMLLIGTLCLGQPCAVPCLLNIGPHAIGNTMNMQHLQRNTEGWARRQGVVSSKTVGEGVG